MNGYGLDEFWLHDPELYGERLNPREILDGKVKKTPEAVRRLWKALEELDKKPEIKGKTPSQESKKKGTS